MSDIYFSYIQLIDRPKEANFFKNATKNSELLLSLKAGDIFNIMGLGRLKIRQIDTTTYPGEGDDSANNYIEICFNCTKTGEALDAELTEYIDKLISTYDEAHVNDAIGNADNPSHWEVEQAWSWMNNG
jgi:hypothetical protein